MITLAMIVPKEEDAKRVKDKYGKYFDEVVIQLAPNTKNFAEARNKMSKKVKTEYYMWLDSDDDIQNPEGISELVDQMDEEGLDAYFLPYEYGYNDEGELIALHWRERLIRTSHPFVWKGAVHETLISQESPRMAQNDLVVIKHQYKGPEDMMKSALRNHVIMEREVKNGDEDPRLLYYLGRSYFMLEKYREAAQTLLIYTEQSGWDEQRYDAWMKISQALAMMDEDEKSINSIWEAIKLLPDNPEAYLLLGDYYLHLNEPHRAIEWLKVGMSKQAPKTLEIVDPTLQTYRPLVSMAKAYFLAGRIKEAKLYIDKAAEYKPKTNLFKSPYEAITRAYIEEQTIKNAAWLGKFVEEQGDIKSYIDGLPGFIKNDLRLRPLRVKAYPPKQWEKKSIVFYCGEQWEDWGPDTLHKGMGGSEEAVTYLSEELAKRGWKVTVYNQREAELKTPAGVVWLPWETFNPEDTFDVFVAWRSPWMAQKLKIKARVRAVDMHDTPMGHQAFPPTALKSVDKIFLKGEFQKRLGKIPDDKAVIASNGIVPEQFDLNVERNPHKVIYASSADRGLDTLVRVVWPKVLEAVPDAELVWPYGWDSYQGMHKGNAKQMKWMWELKRDMHNIGVKELGRLSHEDLAKEMASCSVWAYPTVFPEINCITAIKMQAAGVRPITSGYAALQETILDPEEEVEGIDEPDKIEAFTQRLIDAIKNPLTEEERKDMSKRAVEKFKWANIAGVWDEALSDV